MSWEGRASTLAGGSQAATAAARSARSAGLAAWHVRLSHLLIRTCSCHSFAVACSAERLSLLGVVLEPANFDMLRAALLFAVLACACAATEQRRPSLPAVTPLAE